MARMGKMANMEEAVEVVVMAGKVLTQTAYGLVGVEQVETEEMEVMEVMEVTEVRVEMLEMLDYKDIVNRTVHSIRS